MPSYTARNLARKNWYRCWVIFRRQSSPKALKMSREVLQNKSNVLGISWQFQKFDAILHGNQYEEAVKGVYNE
jgi:hypothetical protein